MCGDEYSVDRKSIILEDSSSQDTGETIIGIPTNVPRLGVLFRLGSLWVGCHYSYKEKRFCINLIPCCTIWFILKGGEPPRYKGIL